MASTVSKSKKNVFVFDFCLLIFFPDYSRVISTLLIRKVRWRVTASVGNDLVTQFTQKIRIPDISSMFTSFSIGQVSLKFCAKTNRNSIFYLFPSPVLTIKTYLENQKVFITELIPFLQKLKITVKLTTRIV